jgi:hypothetical protein
MVAASVRSSQPCIDLDPLGLPADRESHCVRVKNPSSRYVIGSYWVLQSVTGSSRALLIPLPLGAARLSSCLRSPARRSRWGSGPGHPSGCTGPYTAPWAVRFGFPLSRGLRVALGGSSRIPARLEGSGSAIPRPLILRRIGRASLSSGAAFTLRRGAGDATMNSRWGWYSPTRPASAPRVFSVPSHRLRSERRRLSHRIGRGLRVAPGRRRCDHELPRWGVPRSKGFLNPFLCASYGLLLAGRARPLSNPARPSLRGGPMP